MHPDPCIGSRAVFVHGRPGPHPFHGSLARAVGAEFLPTDFRLPYQNISDSRPWRYLSWLVCALTFPNRERYRLFLTECLAMPPVILKRLGRLTADQKLVALMGDEMLYFLKTGRYGSLTAKALTRALATYDALICVGRMQTDIATEILAGSGRRPQILSTSGSVSPQRAVELAGVTPRLDSRRMVFIANGTGGWRGWYKGLDLLLETFHQVRARRPDVRLTVVGEWDRSFVEGLCRCIPGGAENVQFAGYRKEIANVLAESCVYVHLARGDAFPNSVLEALYAGVPAVVSEWTGSRELVAEVDSRLIVPLDARAAADRIEWYLSMGQPEKERLSRRCREVMSTRTQQRAEMDFVAAVSRIMGGVAG